MWLIGGRGMGRRIFAIAPTSAAAERAFSFLHAGVSDRQTGMLDDSLELMLTLKCNESL